MFGHSYFGASYYGSAYWWTPGTGTTVLLAGFSGEKRKEYRKRKEQLQKDVNEAYNKVFGIKQVETVAAVEQVLEDVVAIKQEAVEFDFDGMVEEVRRIEEKAKALLIAAQMEQDDEDVLLLI